MSRNHFMTQIAVNSEPLPERIYGGLPYDRISRDRIKMTPDYGPTCLPQWPGIPGCIHPPRRAVSTASRRSACDARSHNSRRRRTGACHDHSGGDMAVCAVTPACATAGSSVPESGWPSRQCADNRSVDADDSARRFARLQPPLSSAA